MKFLKHSFFGLTLMIAPLKASDHLNFNDIQTEFENLRQQLPANKYLLSRNELDNISPTHAEKINEKIALIKEFDANDQAHSAHCLEILLEKRFLEGNYYIYTLNR